MRPAGGCRLGYAPLYPQNLAKAATQLGRVRRDEVPTDLTWEQFAGWIGPVIHGWMSSYGRYYQSALDALLVRINYHVRQWIRAQVPAAATLPGHEARLGPNHRPDAGAAAPLALGNRGPVLASCTARARRDW